MDPDTEKKEKCSDCIECQMCSKNRCRLCRRGGHGRGAVQLGPCLTHGEYLEWKKMQRNKGDTPEKSLFYGQVRI